MAIIFPDPPPLLRTPRQLTVVVGLHDRPPAVPRGSMVEIIVTERLGPAAAYADLLANPPSGEAEKALAARCLLGLGHERYLEARRQGLDQRHRQCWTGIVRLLQLSRSLLEDFQTFTTWPPAGLNLSELDEQAQLLRRLVATLQTTMLNLLREGTSAQAAVWHGIDSSFSDIVSRACGLHAATERVIERLRAAVATPRYLSVAELLACRANAGMPGSEIPASEIPSTQVFVNQADYQRALELAEQIGLDLGSLTLGLYQTLDAVMVVRGVKD